MALIGYCTCETLLSVIVWVGWSLKPRGNIQKGQGADFCMMERRTCYNLNFSQVFFIPMSLYPLMYLDKKRNKDFFFFVVSHGLFVNCVSLVFTIVIYHYLHSKALQFHITVKNYSLPPVHQCSHHFSILMFSLQL